jgi:hypothetical protein
VAAPPLDLLCGNLSREQQNTRQNIKKKEQETRVNLLVHYEDDDFVSGILLTVLTSVGLLVGSQVMTQRRCL